MNLIEERKENKRKLWLEVVIMVITLLGGTTIILLASYFEMAIGWRIALICIGVAIMVGGISVMCVLELSAGGYQCQKCKAKFVPSFGAYIMGAHTIMYRRLKCPKCGVRNWCKRTLTLGDVEEEPENKEE